MADDDPLASAPTAVGATLAASVTPGGARADEPSFAEVPSLLAGRYEVLALLGVGGMGRVYRVHDRSLDETVALKLLRRELLGTPDVLERFRREVKLARRVTSPHVVRTFDLGEHAGEHFLTMEYVEGRSLAQLLDDGPLTIDEVVRIARAACDGIAAAHAAGVLHRDLKPDNVLVGTSGRIAITDFGIARASAAPGSAAAETQDGFVGTPAYMAPEQVDGRTPVSAATDVYAFGLVVYEMLTGQRAFAGHDAMQVAVARLDATPPDPRALRDVPAGLADIVVRCLARDPAARFSDGGALGAALAAAAAGATQPSATVQRGLAPIVPTKTSRAVAVLPLRSAPDLADLADGLAEEIVDALTVTRALRVRPMASVRALAASGGDPRELGRALGVDVVVDGSLRRIGDIVRIAARAIGVEDGFQLSADRIDARDTELLTAGDAIARAVARALTVELDVPARRATDPRATALYLEGKSKMRASWMLDSMQPAIDLLEQARALAPDDPSIAAAAAIARARHAFYGTAEELAVARALAEHAIALAPDSGDAYLAVGLTCIYACELEPAARAMVRAVKCAPGLALAQGVLGGLLLEAGALTEAIAHLEAALALDPTSVARWDLSRALMYADRDAEAFALLTGDSDRNYAEVLLGRFHAWRGRRYASTGPAKIPMAPRAGAARNDVVAHWFHWQGDFPEGAIEALLAATAVINPRLRAVRMQFATELLCALDQPERALEYIQRGVDAGLYDALWFARCPMLAPLRTDPRYAPRFDALHAVVSARVAAVFDAVGLPRPAVSA